MTTHRSCRACGWGPLTLVFSLGSTPLANRLLSAEQLDQPEPEYPLDLGFCHACTLLQLLDGATPQELFEHYLYLSSFSDTMLSSASDIAQRLSASRGLSSDSLVVELASNDGYLLQFYQRLGIPVLGVEPARNIADIAVAKGIRTISEFFDDALAGRLRSKGLVADVVHANNVLAHVPDLNGFVRGIGLILKPDGIASIEVPHVQKLVDSCEFDTIYHEHLSYFSLTSLDQLFARHSLRIVDVERLDLHGGSLRVFVGHDGDVTDSVRLLLHEEAEAGVGTVQYYERFSERVRGIRDGLRDILNDYRSRGARVAAYGASAKGATLLNYCGIGSDALDFVVDRSTLKQGMYTPGTHLPILAPAALLERRPDLVLLLTWNFAEEILAQQTAYREAGGQFLIPIPTPEIV